jgi:hypothetical protein
MLKSQIRPGAEYALREKRVSRGAFQHIRIVEHLRGNKWKAKWIEPNPGLIVYARSSYSSQFGQREIIKALRIEEPFAMCPAAPADGRIRQPQTLRLRARSE